MRHSNISKSLPHLEFLCCAHYYLYLFIFKLPRALKQNLGAKRLSVNNAVTSHHTWHKIYKTLMVWPALALPDHVAPLSPLFFLLLYLLEISLVLCVFIKYTLPGVFAVPSSWDIFPLGNCLAHLGT